MAELVASAGTADPSKEGFGREGQARFNTPLAHPVGMGGRIVCASRHPPRPLEAWSLAWKRLGVPRGSSLGNSNLMKNASREGSWRLKRPKLHAKGAKRKARKAKKAPKITKLISQMVPRPPQDASCGSLGGDF